MRALAIVMLLAGLAGADPTAAALHQRATDFHRAAQLHGSLAEYQAAAAAYEQYLAAYPTDPGALEANFYLGQILILKLSRGVEGADRMMTVARSKPIGKLHEDALLEAIDAYAAAKQAAKLTAAADLYAALFPSSTRTVHVLFLVGRSALDAGELDRAAKLFGTIVTKFPSDPDAGAAGDLWLEALVRVNDFDSITKTVRLLLASPAFARADQQRRLHRTLVQVMERQAENRTRDHDERGAAEEYLAAAKEAGEDPHRDELLYNAGVMLERAHDLERAVQTFRRLATELPNSPLAERALTTAARLDEALRPERAVDSYIRASAIPCKARMTTRMTPGCREAADARYNAGLLFAALGEVAKARAAFATYLKDFPDGRDADDIAFELGALAARSGDDARAAAAFEAYTKRPHASRLPEAFLGLARAAIHAGQRARADKALAATIVRADRTSRTSAEARFLQGELAAGDAAAIRLTVPPSRLSTALAMRARAIMIASKLYMSIAETSDPGWTVAGLDRLAHVTDAFASELVAAPAPAGPSAAEQQAYRTRLETMIADLEGKAVEQYRAALDKARELRIYSRYALDARAQLVRLRPKDFPAEREARAGLRVDPPTDPRPIFRD